MLYVYMFQKKFITLVLLRSYFCIFIDVYCLLFVVQPVCLPLLFSDHGVVFSFLIHE